MLWEKLHFSRVLSVLIFVGKCLPLSSVCVCVCVCIAETAHVRELKVILMLVLGQHEYVRGKFYINKLVFSKSVSQG